MATTVDERIVAAKFDANDFEKGVDKTIKKLDELKKSLDLKDATKSVKDFAEKTEASTKSIGSSLEKLTDRFTTFTGMIKQKILSGLADEVAGVFLKMEQSVKSFIKSISSDQINAGMDKYTQMLTSVRTMMSAGESEEDAYKSIERLQTYSDETSYSLSQMTDAMSKMVAAGVNLEDATKNVEGIANACANAGINATDASRAFYNLSQAYSKGVLEYTDYRSLELLNMTTREFKEAMIESAVQAGTLKKVGDGVWQTINKNDKKVKAGKKVTLDNLNDMLRYDFMNKAAMNNLFGGQYWMEVIGRDELEKTKREFKQLYGDNWEVELKKKYGELAVEAYEAAKEARSFNDVINALKDAVSTGWSNTFQHLFGKLTQAKDFFTDLANSGLAGVIYDIGEYRNTILEFWDSETADGLGSGGEVFRQSIMNIVEALGTLFHTFQQILPGFDEIYNSEEEGQDTLEKIGHQMFVMTMHLRDFTAKIKEAAENFNKFMNSPIFDDGPTRIELLRQVFANLGSVFGIVAKLIGIGFNAITKAFIVLSPVFDGFLKLLAKITEPITNLKNNQEVFNAIQNSINNILTILDPIAKVLGTIIGFLGEVAAFFVNMSIDTVTSNLTFFSDALGILMELLTGKSAQLENGESVLDKIKNDFEGIKNACKEGLGAVKSFFEALIGDVKELFGLTDGEAGDSDQNGGIFSRIASFFETNEFVQSAKAWINQAIIDIKNFILSIPERLKNLGVNIFDAIYGLFFKEETKYNGSMLETNTVLTPLGEWANNVIQKVKEFITNLPNKIVEGVGKAFNFVNEIFNYLFGEEKVENANATVTQNDIYKNSRFENFVISVTNSIKQWFADLPNKIRKALKSIGNFASAIIKAVDEFLFGKKQIGPTITKDANGKWSLSLVTQRYKTGFSKWLSELIGEIKKFIKDIPEYIKAGIHGVGDIVSAIVSGLFGTGDSESVDTKVEDAVKSPFQNINLTSILETIKGIGETLLNEIARIFTGSEDVTVNQEWFANLIASGITWIRERAKEALDWVLEFLTSIPTRIANLFTGEKSDNAEAGPVGKAILDFGNAIGHFISVDLPNAVLKFIDNAVVAFDGIWNKLYNAITGGSEDTSEVVDEEIANIAWPSSSGMKSTNAKVKSQWEIFIENLGKTIANIWEKLPTWIAEGINLAVEGINALIAGAGDLIFGKSEEQVSNAMQGDPRYYAKTAESIEKNGNKDKPELVNALKNLGESIKKLMLETIPKFISDGWEALKALGADIFAGISSVFSEENVPENERQAAVAGVAEAIKNWFLTDLPGYFGTTWEELGNNAASIFSGFVKIFIGEGPSNEIESAVIAFGQKIYDFITKEIPGFISRAFAFIGGLFTKEDPFEKSLASLSDADRAYVSRYADKMQKDTKSIAKKSDFLAFAENIGNAILEALKIIGPMIINGLAEALDFLGGIATIVTDALTGGDKSKDNDVANAITEKYNQQTPQLKEALVKIGESLKKFFLETLPDFIGAAIGAIIAEAPKWFGKLFTGLNESMQKAADDAEGSADGKAKDPKSIFDSIGGVFTWISDFITNLIAGIGDISSNGWLIAVALIVSLGALFASLKDMFSIADEAEAASDVIKWSALAVAIIGITALAKHIKDLAVSSNDEDVAKANAFLEKLGSFLDTLKWVAGFAAVISIANMVKTLGDKTEGLDILGGGIIGNFLGAFTTGAGVNLGAQVAGAGIDKMMDTISDSLSDLASGLSEAFESFDSFLGNISETKSNLEEAVTVMDLLKTLFEKFYHSWDEILSEVFEIDLTTQAENYAAKDVLKTELFSQLNESLEMFIQVAGIIGTLSTAIKDLENVDDLPGRIEEINELFNEKKEGELYTLLQNMAAMAQYISEFFTHYSFNEFDPGNDDGLQKTSYVMQLLSNTLKVFSEGIAGLKSSKVTALKDSLNLLKELTEALNKDKDVILSSGITGLGRKMTSFGSNIKKFFDSVYEIVGFSETDVAETRRRIDGIIHIVQGLVLAGQGITHFAFDFNLIDSLGGQLPEFAASIGEFMRNLDAELPKDLGTERNQELYDSIESVANILSALKDLAELAMSSQAFDLSKQIEELFTSMSDPKTNASLASIVSSFATAISALFNSEEMKQSFEADGGAIAASIKTGIQNAFDTDPNFEIKITPILNMDKIQNQLTGKTFFTRFSMQGIGDLAKLAQGANEQTDEERVKASDLYVKIGELKTEIETMRLNAATVMDVSNAFVGMRIVTDTGALVGAISNDIDAAIGEKIWLIERNVAPG